MAFKNVSVILLLFSVVLVAAIADARINLNEISTEHSPSAGFRQNFCSSCECKTESETTKCYRTDRKIGGCPLCNGTCLCAVSSPPICICTYEVETCNPEKCNSISTTDMLTFENLLAAKGA
ncbi:Bowman-Birk type proteinase inhibitor isoform X2 [Morus notabilis]|uniref:Bowman-Birk type proteinase inhibitor isoform X2 n=1 Tax=Morus notabilis TaxID=981085 RepID=UPI000CED03C8|nr:Bowman-Birk type proteinase inhibitor isoform X2 [Morus notabilis]